MSIKIKQIIITVFLFSLLACSTNKSTTSKVTKIEAVELNRILLTTHDSLQVVDVRTPEEFATGHLNNAINIDYNASNFEEQIKKLNKTKPVYIYCKAGGRSSEAVNIFTKNKFKEIYDLKGGIMSWERSALPITGIIEPTIKPTSQIPNKDLIEKRENLSVEEFQTIVAESPITIVDFTAVWCGPCRKLSPILDELERTYGYKIKVIKIDVDKNKAVSNYYAVSLIPFLQFYKNGRVQEQIEGLPSRENLIYQIDKLLK